jgi:hypothetical protein
MEILVDCVRMGDTYGVLSHVMLPPQDVPVPAAHCGHGVSATVIIAYMLAYTQTSAGLPLIAQLMPHSGTYATLWLTKHWKSVQYLVHAYAAQIPLPDSEHWRALLCRATEEYLMVHIDNGYDVSSCDYW